MLRRFAFALLGISLLAGPAAARGGEGSGSGGGRRAEAKVARGAKAERAFFVRRVSSATTTRSMASGPACARVRGALRCRGGGAVQAVNWRWSQGLPPALGVQAQECPAGTMATLAEGHEDIVRCIPI
jgi:hypothetical protein